LTDTSSAGRSAPWLAKRCSLAARRSSIPLVEQYFDFARDLADDFVVMDRGEVVLAGFAASMVEAGVRRCTTI
jgi:urea transport system ATP-binding protein